MLEFPVGWAQEGVGGREIRWRGRAIPVWPKEGVFPGISNLASQGETESRSQSRRIYQESPLE